MKKEVKKRVSHRLKIVEGQVRGLQKKIDEDAYCVDIITQSSAIRHALGSIEDLVLENHLTTHVKEQMQSGEDKKATEEILAIYKLAKKK
tara:strand:- start:385461 stop:385730 length:270 start_codon:yes stop_codon:yes gene_type:complete